MNKYKLAVIGANEPLLPFYQQINKEQFEVYGFAWEKGAVCKKYCDKFYPISFTEKEKILEICQNINIDGITSFSLESAIPTVNYIASNMGLICNADLVLEWIGYKNKMREILASVGLPMPKSIVYNDKLKSTQIPKCPIIVKPVDGGGSKGVTLVESEAELQKAINYALSFSKLKKVIIEEYIEGDEVSVEYISYQGKHYFLSITDKVTSGNPHFVELEHKQPSGLESNIQEKIKDVVQASLTVLGVTNSPSHTELRIDKIRGPIIIEVGPRMGGGHITSDLVKLSTGYDFVDGACNLACKNFIQPDNLINKKAHVIFYTPYTKDKVDHILNNNTCNVFYNNLTKLNSVCNNNSERSGCLIISE